MKRAILKPPIKMSAERKKVISLGVLVVIAVLSYFWSSSDTPSSSSSTAATPAATKQLPGSPAALPARPSGRNQTRGIGRGSTQAGPAQRGGSLQEFRPTLKPKDPIDPSRIDPTLKLPLLARVKNVSLQGGGRSLFDFSGAPAPTTEIAKVKPILPGQKLTAFVGPVKPPPPAPPAPPAPPPPIPLKFYGFNTLKQGNKRAFFLEGEDIFVAGEGDLIKNRYKVVRIGVNSAVVEDTTNKHEQTLPLEAEQVST
jgi:hypothetical protein